jgi:hypothetical protein
MKQLRAVSSHNAPFASYKTARVHHAARRRGSGVAARGRPRRSLAPRKILAVLSYGCIVRMRATHETPQVRNCRGYAVKICGNRNRFLSAGRCVRIDLSRVRSQNFLWDSRCSPGLALDRLSSERMAPAGHRAQRHCYFWPSCSPVARADVTSTDEKGVSAPIACRRERGASVGTRLDSRNQAWMATA